MTEPEQEPAPSEAELAAHPRQAKPGEVGAHHDPTLPPIGEHRAPGSHLGLLDVEEEVVKVVLGQHDVAAGEPLPIATFSKLLSATAVFATLLAVAYLVPFEWAQPWRPGEDYVPYWNIIGRELMGQGATAAADADEAARMAELAAQADQEDEQAPVAERKVVEPPPKSDDALRYPEYAAHELDPKPDAIEQALDNPEALAPFYEALTHSDIGYAGAVTHVAHWGDSVLGNDGITSAIRRRMQARFGDAGHGFHALKQYDASYKHKGVVFEEKGSVRWESCFIRNRCMKTDGRYGYGGVTVWSSGGATSEYRTADEGPVGLQVSAFEVWYQQRYKGGQLRVRIDGGPDKGGRDEIIETALPVPEGFEPKNADERPDEVDAWARISVPDGPHSFEVRVTGGGVVRAYGVVLERDSPGVVWDGMALIGSFTSRLSEQDPTHLADQLGHRGTDLMVFTFGGNDMTREQSDLRRTMDPYIEDYTKVIQLFKQARPEAACLIMGPVDHGEREGGRVVSRGVVGRMTEAQRQVALANGCAFFDTFAAMGGDGSIARWKNEGLMSGDLAHPTGKGHKLLGSMVYDALMVGYIAFRKSKAGQPMALRPGAMTHEDEGDSGD